ncbi:hypothetical protein FPCIR_2096 [Fusarium pseudocircinatum]|uniref:Uncharacterized protein n=1 Tax=Fusarium pseudocircinatum TaxID=56676 RepID=A0A8H5PSE7_9HYPO|nr:hypothetical protein FPCIR_2096 [Fusarium pseudocircinatum]
MASASKTTPSGATPKYYEHILHTIALYLVIIGYNAATWDFPYGSEHVARNDWESSNTEELDSSRTSKRIELIASDIYRTVSNTSSTRSSSVSSADNSPPPSSPCPSSFSSLSSLPWQWRSVATAGAAIRSRGDASTFTKRERAPKPRVMHPV